MKNCYTCNGNWSAVVVETHAIYEAKLLDHGYCSFGNVELNEGQCTA